jgi:signal transduction histidine kinase
MDLFFRNSSWKVWLIVAGAIILLISSTYTYYLTEKLKEGEQSKIELLSKAYEQLINKRDLNEDLNTEADILESNTSIPLIIVDPGDDYLEGKNFGPGLDSNQTYLKKELNKIKAQGLTAFKIESYSEDVLTNEMFVYYKHSRVLQLLSWFPLFQLLLISAFILIGYFGMTAARRAEQNRVWAGLAKETAHQLGTPISAIMAWIELLDSSLDPSDENRQVVQELDKDVKRLDLIAERFSKVGSKPELELLSIKQVVTHSVDYMRRRASRNVQFVFDTERIPDLKAKVNPPLFEWVVENLLRNALDAMDGKGNIVIDLYEQDNWVNLDISDTGKGIAAGKFKKVFEPGFSTKKRGWGLGLSLAKRIIEMYHKGKIYIKESKINIGTTFTIRIPKAPRGI